MKHNPDIYLLYEYMKKIAYTVRIKVTLRENDVSPPARPDSALYCLPVP